MKRAISYVSLFMLSHLALSFFLAMTPFYSYANALTFLLPLLLFLTPPFRELPRERLEFSLRPLAAFLPLFPVFLCAVILTSTLTAFVSSVIGYIPSPVLPSGGVIEVALTHILLPAICEELFCRYACLSLLSPYGKSGAVVISALMFSIMHGNFYQMPYAFVAGLLLGAITLCSHSVIPAIIFHILNNLISVVIYYSGDGATLAIYGVTLILLPVGFAIAVKNGAYRSLCETMTDGSARSYLSALISPLAIIYILIMLALAV